MLTNSTFKIFVYDYMVKLYVHVCTVCTCTYVHGKEIRKVAILQINVHVVSRNQELPHKDEYQEPPTNVNDKVVRVGITFCLEN